MRWKNRRRSQNIEDRRGTGRSGAGRKIAGGGLGALVLAAIALFFGVDQNILNQLTGQSNTTASNAAYPSSAKEQELAELVSTVLADTEQTWQQIFASAGQHYPAPKLVLFSGAVQSACGFADRAAGPFYCSGDQKIYIDLSFFDTLKQRFQAPGDFAQAYVIAHEVGHHVQTLLGFAYEIQRRKQRQSQTQANQLQVKMELQADCFAGVWANHAHNQRNWLEHGDIEEGLTAAAAVGDDTIQKRARGYVVPESFTHGTAAQRRQWFLTGLKSGDISTCNPFGV